MKTAEVAKMLGLGKRRLHRKIASGRYPVPERNQENGYYEWTSVDIQLFTAALQKDPK